MTITTTPDKMAANDHKLQDEARALLAALRASRRRRQKKPLPEGQQFTLGQEVADHVAAFMRHWDPNPFILLSLALSFQAAGAAPFIMMSQNRQAAIDRQDAANDYKVNIKAELEIELLHH